MDSQLPRRRRIKTLFQRIEESTASLVPVRSPQPSLCKQCQCLRFQPLREGKVQYLGNPKQIDISAQAGCPLCSLLLENFDLGPRTMPIRLSAIRRKLSLQEQVSLVEEGDIEALGVFNGYDRGNENPFAHKLALYTTHDDVAAPFIKRRPFINDFAGKDTFRLIKSWLDTCVFHHPGCNSPIISKLPTRVIDVGLRGVRQDPILFTPPPGYKDSYIALSYCWGDADSKFVLTKDKARLPKLEFPFATLPKTLQDAVWITQTLGFRFLWIDALCIIQEGDSGEDFLRESATMRHVYGNATLTIAAAAATNVHEGIFRQPTADPHPEIKIPYDLCDGTIGTAFIEFEDIKKGESRINEPLNTRGWTFQERILSPRVVVFYKDQLSWDCTSTLINSNGPINPLVTQNQDSPGRYSDYIASRALVDAESDLSEKAKYMAYWRTLIEFYSRRTLSNTNDKLKAIAGLAQLIKSKTNDSYVAGLWRSDIWTQLLWYTEDPLAKRQSEYRAPTWSWASIDGQVKFWNEKSSVNVGRLYDYVEVDMELDPSEDEFGEIIRARLRIRGHLHCWNRGLRSAQKAANEHEKNSHSLIDPLKWFGIFIDEFSDEEDILSADSDLSYYFFYPSQPLCTSSPAIILKTVDSTTYRRVGIFSEARYSQRFLEQWLQQWNKNAAEIITIE